MLDTQFKVVYIYDFCFVQGLGKSHCSFSPFESKEIDLPKMKPRLALLGSRGLNGHVHSLVNWGDLDCSLSFALVLGTKIKMFAQITTSFQRAAWYIIQTLH